MCLDLINNNFGDEFDNIRTYQNSCNVGINLRTGNQSGSDLSFYNMWVVGPVAGVSISGGGGGYHFWGGQIGTDNNTSPQDLTAAIILCKDYLTGATGDATLISTVLHLRTRIMHGFSGDLELLSFLSTRSTQTSLPW